MASWLYEGRDWDATHATIAGNEQSLTAPLFLFEGPQRFHVLQLGGEPHRASSSH
jgi:hypothetical protein